MRYHVKEYTNCVRILHECVQLRNCSVIIKRKVGRKYLNLRGGRDLMQYGYDVQPFLSAFMAKAAMALTFHVSSRPFSVFGP
jgi:hypothetical protein